MTESEQFCQDLDLIKLAAKAAGMHWETESYGSLLMTWGKNQPSGKPFVANGCYSGWSWNPLTDDGDALRLAVKLGINIQCKESGGGFISAGSFAESVKPDKEAAIRRVIVRVAAEIGKEVK